ncbi:MAG: hypothetical protein JRF33_12540 [Deltaproteobacteria bacterium]|nr:hypothetical protein [Deltaproteobacteria bacterium]
MNFRSRNGNAWLQVLIILGLGGLMAMQVARRGPQAPAQTRGPLGVAPARALSLKPILSLTLHGATPCMAWSPNNRRLVVNSAFEPWTDPKSLQGDAKRTHGLHVLDLPRRKTIHVTDTVTFHPFWLNDRKVAFVRNAYTGSDSGLFTAHAGPHARLRRIGPKRNLHSGFLAKNGKLLIFVDGEPGYGWYYMNRNTGKLKKAPVPEDAGGDMASSWARPHELIVEQCPQRVGNVSVASNPELGVGLQIGQQLFNLTDEQPWKFQRGGGGNPMVQPCLSPDGRKLAYLTDNGAGGMEVKVVKVPSLQLALAMSRAPASSDMPSLSPSVSMLLHGSTPSMAWSPDGRRVLANASYEYYGYDAEIRSHAEKLGIWILDAYMGQSTRVFDGQGYHPFWLGNQSVGWGHSKYEDGPPGLFVAAARGMAPVRRIGTLAGVHRTAAGRNGKILVYVGWPEYKRWGYVDPDSGAFAPLPALEKVSSWKTPKNLIEDQCLQTQGDIKLTRDGKFGVLLEVGGRRFRLATEPLFRFSGDYGSGAAKAVSACLSPSGEHVAYLVNAGRAKSELRIAAIPR